MKNKRFLLLLIAAILLQACSSTRVGASFSTGRYQFKQQNYHAAFKDLLPLAQKGNARAQYAIGYMYYNGLGVKQSLKQAEFWLHKASTGGDKNAQNALAMIDKARASDPFPPPHALYALHDQARKNSVV